jgi:hypothetical protein
MRAHQSLHINNQPYHLSLISNIGYTRIVDEESPSASGQGSSGVSTPLLSSGMMTHFASPTFEIPPAPTGSGFEAQTFDKIAETQSPAAQDSTCNP